MKFLILLFFVGIAVSRAEVCEEEKAEKCVEQLMVVLLGDQNQDEVCRELEGSLNCLRAAIADCNDEDSNELNEGLAQLQSLLKDNCEDEDDEDEVEEELSEVDKCFQDNEDYIKECILESASKVISIMVKTGEIDDDAMSCVAYHLISDCVIERVEEKCGEEAKQDAEEELKDMPEEVKKACDAAGPLDVLSLELLGNKKSK